MARKRSRTVLTASAGALIIAGLAYAFWPRPLLVDTGEVTRGTLTVTIDEEGRTRVHDTYVVSTPVTGRLMRVEVEPGDFVEQGKTVVARMLPTNPSALDIRTREQARAAVSAAEAALRVARADYNKAVADKELAEAELERARRLLDANTVSQAAFDRAEREARAARATLDTAEAAIAMREAEVDSARAQLISFDGQEPVNAPYTDQTDAFPLLAPTTGRILRVMQQSETTLAAGTSIMEIGNVDSDLEVIVELLSTDAVQVKAGDRVIIDNWGGEGTLSGTVERVDPWGFTKVSALGVEEQRVNAIVRFTDSPEKLRSLGHGFRVEVRIVISEDENAIIVPSSALFRDGQAWSVFVFENGRASLRPIKLGRNNGISASVTDGLQPGDHIVLYPASGLRNGTRVAQR